jgi:hypothetical protein
MVQLLLQSRNYSRVAQPIFTQFKTTFTLDFDGQVPIQIRRSGRNNAEGVELSKWYPKLAEFDFEGWHADPYIAREFHGVWGNFDVKITIDKLRSRRYRLLTKQNEIGFGYQDQGVVVNVPKKKTLTWHFNAPMVHDFTWAADKIIFTMWRKDLMVSTSISCIKQPKFIQNWKNLQPKTITVNGIYNKTVGDYPYKQYSVIQGGGMEYAMCTLILGQGTFEGLLGVTARNGGFQHVLASNESSTVGWTKDLLHLEDFGLDAIADKSRKPIFGWL